jgi:hypothetical protein
MAEWKVYGTNKTVIIDDSSKTTKNKTKTKSKLTGTRIYVTCFTDNEFIIECCNDGTLKNVSTADTNDYSRFQATLVDYDNNTQYMVSSFISMDWDQDALSCKRSLKNQYFDIRDKVRELCRSHVSK